ncbi:MAG: 2-(1,2-epoxy-1,2-dihydrophenyl)acetyl-CoA isomerase [Chloroflexota bacterium]|nr:MAG: 2-(1,2-epoxy-1,2-dihydrophenyl)acetyl-CoA isomerase [Chloroflexota bacterium]
MTFQSLQYHEKDGVATIVLNRPETFNALSIQMGWELLDALKRCAERKDVRAVVITGVGQAFSSGGDIRGMRDALEGDVLAFFLKLTKSVHDAILAIRELPKPVVASINGVTAGGGLGIAMACDLRIASDAAKFNTAYLNIAASPDCGTSYFLTKSLGHFKATELFLLPRNIDAAEALQLGLVHRVAPAKELAQATYELAARLASGPTVAIGRTKQLLNSALQSDLAAQLNQEGWSIAQSGTTEDFREGIEAFLAKRASRFTGR